MYKLLPILLFGFLITEENLDKHFVPFVESDSLDFIWAEEQLDLWIKNVDEKFTNLINKDKFLIRYIRQVYDVKRLDTLDTDLVDSKLTEMKAISMEKRHKE